ncbi:MAG: AAA family ATPase [Anaerolineae bacterium]|nr:AAA family ATPase [Anaerolineae bacterium]
MTLHDYLSILRRRGWIILLTLVVAISAGVVLTKGMTPVYEASAMLRVLTANEGQIGQYSNYNIFYADRLMRTYSHIAASAPVVAEVVDRLQLAEPPGIEIQIIADTELMKLTAEHRDPALAAAIVNTLSDVLVARSRELYGEGVLGSEILGEQLAQVELEFSDAQAEYLRALNDSAATQEDIDDARQMMVLKQGIYVSLQTQYQNAQAEEMLRLNAVQIVETAAVPDSPSRPNLILNVALTALFGIVAGSGLAFAAESLDTRMHSSQELEETADLPILGQVPAARRRSSAIFDLGTSHYAAFRRAWIHISAVLDKHDQLMSIKGIGAVYGARLRQAGITSYRQLASMTPDELGAVAGIQGWAANQTARWIEQAQRHLYNNGSSSAAHPPLLLLVTSARAGEGKSTCSANLAVAAAHCDQRVLLIDSDLWLPTQHQLFGTANEVGLIDVLRGRATLKTAVQHTGYVNVDLLTSGSPLSAGDGIPGFDTLPALIFGGSRAYDIIIVDSPALLEMADSAVLARNVGAVLLVVAYARTSRRDLTSAIRLLHQVEATPVGMLVNRAPKRDDYYYSHRQPSRDAALVAVGEG